MQEMSFPEFMDALGLVAHIIFSMAKFRGNSLGPTPADHIRSLFQHMQLRKAPPRSLRKSKQSAVDPHQRWWDLIADNSGEKKGPQSARQRGGKLAIMPALLQPPLLPLEAARLLTEAQTAQHVARDANAALELLRTARKALLVPDLRAYKSAHPQGNREAGDCDNAHSYSSIGSPNEPAANVFFMLAAALVFEDSGDLDAALEQVLAAQAEVRSKPAASRMGAQVQACIASVMFHRHEVELAYRHFVKAYILQQGETAVAFEHGQASPPLPVMQGAELGAHADLESAWHTESRKSTANGLTYPQGASFSQSAAVHAAVLTHNLACACAASTPSREVRNLLRAAHASLSKELGRCSPRTEHAAQGLLTLLKSPMKMRPHDKIM